MRRALVILSLTAASAVLFGAGPPKPAVSTRSAEVARLQHHFDSVDIELISRDLSSFTPSQQASRARLRRWLREYRDAATFPKNDRFEMPTPFFRDREGTLCAMAYLIDRSGRGDIVDRVAATRNNAYIRDLADDPALIAWLDSVALTVAEAARIQPAYGGYPFDPDNPGPVDGDFALAALGLGSTSLAMSAVNVMKPSYLSGFLGVLAGTASIYVGANHLNTNSGTQRVAAATTALGAVSVGAGIYGILEAREEKRERHRDRWRDGRRRRYSMIIAPDVAFQRASPQLGLLVYSSF